LIIANLPLAVNNAYVMDLIIVESPTKARTLGSFLGDGYRVEPTMGHVRDLPLKEFGIDLTHDFAPTYVLIVKKRSEMALIKKLAPESNRVLLATDPDREGEAIAWHVEDILTADRKLKISRDKFSRITFHEITKPAIEAALASPRQVDQPLVAAQQARRILDRLVGYKLSPLLWKKVKRGLSAGRVQSVAVRLIVEREKEIEAFKPEEYWEIWVELTPAPTSQTFWAKLVTVQEAKVNLKTKNDTDPIIDHLNTARYTVMAVDAREARRSPAAPFTTSTLQQTAANRLGWSAKRTMQMAQDLYEKGLITYHRTDSTNISPLAISAARDLITRDYSAAYLPSEPRYYKTKSKVAQEAHEAIRPTDVAARPVAIHEKQALGREESRLYDLVWKRFLASQMTDALFTESKVSINAQKETVVYGLEARGSQMNFDGWLKLYLRERETETESEPTFSTEEALPLLQNGDALQKKQVRADQKFSQPPARFSEASLIKKLEELGIGRPSTYAPILTTIQDRQYVEKIDPKTGLPPGKALKPTSLGTATNDFLVGNFADIVDYDFTANMEAQLDEIANGEKQWVPVIRAFYEPFAAELERVSRTAAKVAVELEETGEMCPECGEGKLVIRHGRFGKFISCSRFPDCKYRAPLVPKIEGLKCPDDGGDVVLRRTRKGKIFYGCRNWPKCKWASWTKPKLPVESDPTKTKI
jgi:DNA topoisomerase-1